MPARRNAASSASADGGTAADDRLKDVPAPAKPDIAAPDQPVDDSGEVDTTDAGGPQDDVQANQAAGY